jgi:hypothetical protein
MTWDFLLSRAFDGVTMAAAVCLDTCLFLSDVMILGTIFDYFRHTILSKPYDQASGELGYIDLPSAVLYDYILSMRRQVGHLGSFGTYIQFGVFHLEQGS